MLAEYGLGCGCTTALGRLSGDPRLDFLTKWGNAGERLWKDGDLGVTDNHTVSITDNNIEGATEKFNGAQMAKFNEINKFVDGFIADGWRNRKELSRGNANNPAFGEIGDRIQKLAMLATDPAHSAGMRFQAGLELANTLSELSGAANTVKKAVDASASLSKGVQGFVATAGTAWQNASKQLQASDNAKFNSGPQGPTGQQGQTGDPMQRGESTRKGPRGLRLSIPNKMPSVGEIASALQSLPPQSAVAITSILGQMQSEGSLSKDTVNRMESALDRTGNRTLQQVSRQLKRTDAHANQFDQMFGPFSKAAFNAFGFGAPHRNYVRPSNLPPPPSESSQSSGGKSWSTYVFNTPPDAGQWNQPSGNTGLPQPGFTQSQMPQDSIGQEAQSQLDTGVNAASNVMNAGPALPSGSSYGGHAFNPNFISQEINQGGTGSSEFDEAGTGISAGSGGTDWMYKPPPTNLPAYLNPTNVPGSIGPSGFTPPQESSVDIHAGQNAEVLGYGAGAVTPSEAYGAGVMEGLRGSGAGLGELNWKPGLGKADPNKDYKKLLKKTLADETLKQKIQGATPQAPVTVPQTDYSQYLKYGLLAFIGIPAILFVGSKVLGNKKSR